MDTTSIPKRPLVLIADDDECMISALTVFLKQNGYDVVEAGDGRQALHLFTQDSPNMVLLDVTMPIMDGFATCLALRDCPCGAQIPIIMMTGLSDGQSVDQAFASGADDYVTKPIHWAVLRQRIRMLIERRKSEEIILHQATFDGLTDLPNRTLFMDRLDHAISLARRNQENLAVMFIDLDRFKEINDTLGHASGDELLRQVADRLKQCVRHSDTVARLGGDEFTIILSSITLPIDPEIMASKILHVLSQPFEINKNTVIISASVGITLFPKDADTLDHLLKNADQAMYMAKHQGRNCFKLFKRKTNLLDIGLFGQE